MICHYFLIMSNAELVAFLISLVIKHWKLYRSDGAEMGNQDFHNDIFAGIF